MLTCLTVLHLRSELKQLYTVIIKKPRKQDTRSLTNRFVSHIAGGVNLLPCRTKRGEFFSTVTLKS